MEKVWIDEGGLHLSDMVCSDEETVAFFSELSATAREAAACRALSLGTLAIRTMHMAGRIGLVEDEFAKLSARFTEAMDAVQDSLLQQVDKRFDPDEKESVSGQLGLMIAEAHKGASETLDTVRAELVRVVDEAFNPELTSSSVFQLMSLIKETREGLQRAFDPAYEDSHLSKLAAQIDLYFGEDGVVGDVVSAQLVPMKEALEKQLADLRDLVVSKGAADAARRLSPASGEDFEEEVEAFLQGLAEPYGDVVERVGNKAGNAGSSKRGDFVIHVNGGPRFIIEAKDVSDRLTLRGADGILKYLDDSMINRSAEFGIAVVKEPTALPKMVGSFNEYDANKLVCALGEEGILLATAYRWARASLLRQGATATDLDVAAIDAGLRAARSAIRELGKIEGKAKGLAKTAEDIASIASAQIRKVNAALDEATRGVSPPTEEAS